MGSRVRIRLLHILHFVIDFLFPLLKNSKSGVDDRGHRFGSGSPLPNYAHAASAIIDRFNMASVGKIFIRKQQDILSEVCHCYNPFLSF